MFKPADSTSTTPSTETRTSLTSGTQTAHPPLLTTDDEGRPYAVHPDSNILPPGATRAEQDVHWFFNFAEGEMTPHVTYSQWDQSLLASRSSVGNCHERVDFTDGQLRAARRSIAIGNVLGRLSEEHVRVLQRWAAAPRSFPETLRETFGRLAGVALRTPTAHRMGASRAPDVIVAACACVRRKEKGEAKSLERQRCKRQIEQIQIEAAALRAGAFTAYARAAHAIAAEGLRDEELRANAEFERRLHACAHTPRRAGKGA